MRLISHVAVAALALAGTAAAHAADLPSGYTQCADEGGTCAVGTAIQEVAYGAEGKWVTKQLSGNVSCTNAIFGDPYRGKRKVCAVKPLLVDPIAENMLLLQTASGGWSKHYKGKDVDYERRYSAAEISELGDSTRKDDATIDNKATTTEIAYLAGAYLETGQTRYLDSARRGVEYLLAAQYPAGGWPQYFPDRSSYRHQITYNDDAMARVIHLLQDVAEGRDEMAVLSKEYGARAQVAVQRGLDCILATQVRINGAATLWAAQYDELTMKPAKARAYELPSLASSESVGIIRLLMRQPNPSTKMKTAVVTATNWLEAHRQRDIAVQRINDSSQPTGQDVVLVSKPGASLWARFYDLKTERPLFANRDGKQVNSLKEVDNERRVGYAWYGTWPDKLLKKELPEWKKKHGMK